MYVVNYIIYVSYIQLLSVHNSLPLVCIHDDMVTLSIALRNQKGENLRCLVMFRIVYMCYIYNLLCLSSVWGNI